VHFARGLVTSLARSLKNANRVGPYEAPGRLGGTWTVWLLIDNRRPRHHAKAVSDLTDQVRYRARRSRILDMMRADRFTRRSGTPVER